MPKLITAVAALLAALAFAPSALAGGWSVVTLDTLPRGVQPRQEVTIGFTVRQHGQMPLGGLTPTITLQRGPTGERVTAAARPDGTPGHYTARFTLPSAGSWSWSIDVFDGPHRMPALDAGASGAGRAAPPIVGDLRELQLGLGLLAVLSALGSLLLARGARRRARVPAAL